MRKTGMENRKADKKRVEWEHVTLEPNTIKGVIYKKLQKIFVLHDYFKIELPGGLRFLPVQKSMLWQTFWFLWSSK